MSPRTVIFRTASLALTTISMCFGGPSQADDLVALLRKNSPFGSAAQNQSVAPAPTISFRGYIYEDNDFLLSLSNADADGRTRSTWVKVGESYAGYLVRSFDGSSETVVLEQLGRRQVLGLQKGRVKLLAVSTQPPETDRESEEALDQKERIREVMDGIRRRREQSKAGPKSTSGS
jgi:hypothetical protein